MRKFKSWIYKSKKNNNHKPIVVGNEIIAPICNISIFYGEEEIHHKNIDTRDVLNWYTNGNSDLKIINKI